MNSIQEYNDMTQYYTTTYETGTYSDYYSDYLHRNSTTASGTGYNLDNFSIITGTTSTWTQQTYINMPYMVVPHSDYKPSEQELSRQKEERIKAAEVAKKAKEEAEEAARKSRLLLLEYLDNENMQRLLNKEPLEIPSKLFGDIKYHIPISNGRIKAWKENKVITELCLTVKESGYLPTDDIILTKLLHILHDEENMLRTANHFNKQENLLARLN